MAALSMRVRQTACRSSVWRSSSCGPAVCLPTSPQSGWTDWRFPRRNKRKRYSCENTSMAYTRISVEQAKELMEKRNAKVVDVRDPGSYEAGHIPGAESVSDSNVGTFIQSGEYERPLIVCCYHGNMSQGAADYFNRNGFQETYSLDGGYEAWRAAA